MKCPYCQNEYSSNMTACPVCFAPKPEGAAEANGQNFGGFSTAVEIIKKIGRSKLLLVSCILQAVFCVLSFFANSSLSVLETLTCVMLWLFYYDSTKQNSSPYIMNTTPLSVIKVVLNIQYVFCWIGAVGCILGIGLLTFASQALGSTDFDVPIKFLLVILLIAFVAVTAELILKKGLLSYFKSFIESAKTGMRPQKLPEYVPYFWIGYTAVKVIISVAMFFTVENLIIALTTLIISLSPEYYSVMGIPDNILDSTSFLEITNNISSLWTLLSSIMLFVIPLITNILFSFLLLKAKKLSDSSLYPSDSYYRENQNCFTPEQ